MRGPRRSNAPKHRPRRCPRDDCPDPTLEFRWKGSIQYHCYGCWRVFNDGGQQRDWVQQTSPSKTWLNSRAQHLRGKPALLQSPRPSAPPSTAVQGGDATLYGVPASTVLPAAAMPSRRRVAARRAGTHPRVPSNAARPSMGAGVLGEEHGLASEFDVHIADAVGGHGSGTWSTPAWEGQLSAFHRRYGDHLVERGTIPAWVISDSPVADAPGGNEVRGASILPALASLPSVINSDNSKSPSDSESPDATDKHLAGPSAQKTLKLNLNRYAAGTLILNLP